MPGRAARLTLTPLEDRYTPAVAIALFPSLPKPPTVAAVAPPAAATLSVNQQVIAFARANVGKAVDVPGGADCYDFAAAALRAAGAKPQTAYGNAGPIADHHVWGRLVYQKSKHTGYANAGRLADIRAGDVIQLDRYRQVGPSGWAYAYHHTAIVERVDVAAGKVWVLHQNWNGKRVVTRSVLAVSEMTEGVFSVYRPQAG